MPDFKNLSTPEDVITARLHPSGFGLADSNFYSMAMASDGCVYYTLSSHEIETHGRCYRYDPAKDELREIIDLGVATGEAGKKSLPQGKSHSKFYELNGKLYISTHRGFFATVNGKEMLGAVPEGYTPYPGGHILEYDMKTGEVKDLARTAEKEGILTFAIDAQRERLYGLTWPTGRFLVYDIKNGELKDLGPACRGGEGGEGDQYFCLCRVIAVDPRDGMAYFTNPDGEILRYDPNVGHFATFEGVNMKRDIFGHWDPHIPGHQGYNWRDIVWHEETQLFWGVHPKSGWLFTFDPPNRKIELVERICADELRRSGQFEPFKYGYLTLAFGPDRKTIYYLTSTYGLTAEDGRDVPEQMHLITYNIETKQYIDHGGIRLENGLYPLRGQTIAVHPCGRIFTTPWLESPNATNDQGLGWTCELISFADPLADKK